MKKMLAVGAIAMIAVIMMASILGISANKEQANSNNGGAASNGEG